MGKKITADTNVEAVAA